MIKPETFAFLADLAENNNRDWFQTNKQRFNDAQENMTAFAAELIKALANTDSYVDAAIEPKKTVMRIYRDVRFSKDKTPYKTNMAIGRLTRYNIPEIGYWLQIEPGQSFIAGGYWMPSNEHLKAIRQEIDYSGSKLIRIVDAPEFKELFGEFRDQEQLKTLPKGYEADHENIRLLKLKSFIAYRDLTNEELQAEDAVKKVASLCSKIQPLNVFLNQAIN
ncbi:DUF2461 domain-containing protein [Mucilaginibacter robiniae]|uniref:DUF2461 domain-containing protein n=2 Tax=Mucilaginibacter robiniae TaxID=2728022 RepID=A0A7L5E4T4_9SPHI|nr:DUF2461 domain-containing protein [Mucilaginibacter robiniae]